MNIVVLVGHPSSGFEEVECQLRQCGMNGAMPSQRDGKLPKEITNALCRAHSTPRLDTVESVSCFRQYEAGVVWHGMALDLLLGNLDEMLWGWSDPQCIFWLEYWKTLVPQITFILVYNEPQSVLSQAGLSDFENKCDSETKQLLSNWKAYNEALLDFFLHNRERCLLVHSQQVPHALDDHLSQLRSRLSGTAESHESALRLPDAGSQNLLIPGSTEKPHTPTIRALNQMMGILEKNPPVLDMIDHGTPVRDFILSNVVNLYPDCQLLYQELQSVANLPREATRVSEYSCESAWVSLLKQEEFASGIIREIQRRYQNLQEQSEEFRRERELLENNLLRIQGKLESSVSITEKQASELSNLRELGTLADQRLRQIEELTSHAENLDAELSTTKCLLSYIQDQLEECYSELLESRNANERKIREIKELSQQREILLEDTAKQIQQHNASLAEKEQQIQQHNATLAAKELQIQQLAQQHNAMLAENAQRIQNLSKQNAEIFESKKMEILVITQQQETIIGEKDRMIQELSCQITDLNNNQQYLTARIDEAAAYATQRVKEQLSYQLGYTIVSRSRTLGGWLGMPLAVRRTIKSFYRKRRENPPQEMQRSSAACDHTHQ